MDGVERMAMATSRMYLRAMVEGVGCVVVFSRVCCYELSCRWMRWFKKLVEVELGHKWTLWFFL